MIEWADAEARERKAIYTLYAVISRDGENGLVRLVGWNPTANTGPTLERRQPPGINPTWGTLTNAYGRSS